MSDAAAQVAITRAHHEEWARVVAALARRFGDLDVAEDATAEAFVIAVRRWPSDGVPPNPGAWLTTTASRRAIDRLRQQNTRDDNKERPSSCTPTRSADLATSSTTTGSG